MLSRRLPPPSPPQILLPLLLGFVACGGDKPPPRSAAAPGPARSSALHARRASAEPAGSSAPAAPIASMGDSALEPAAAEATTSEDWARAESLYRELARRQPRNGAAKRGLGVALMHENKNDDALAALEESLRLADEPGTRLDIAACFAGMDRYPSALPHLRKAVQLAPREPRAWTQLEGALVKVEKPESAAEAVHESRKACTACANDDGWKKATDDVARALAAKADKQVGSGDGAGARKSSDLAVALRPELPEAQLALGKVARAEGDRKAAATAYRKAVAGLPDPGATPGAAARLELATLLLSSGQAAEARQLAEQVVGARQEDGAALDTLGRACDATRDVDCARKAYVKLMKLPATDPAAQGALEHARLRVKKLKGRRR